MYVDLYDGLSCCLLNQLGRQSYHGSGDDQISDLEQLACLQRVWFVLRQ